MLLDLLRLIVKGGPQSISDLARELEISPALVQQMIADLVQQGYLQSLPSACDSYCVGCPLGDSVCSISGMAQAWMLTQRGDRLIKETRG